MPKGKAQLLEVAAAVPNTELSSNSKGKGKKKHIGNYVLSKTKKTKAKK
jgi:hypothetical protein